MQVKAGYYIVLDAYCPGGGFRFVTPTGKTNTDKIPLSKSKQETVQKINSIIFK
jgi:hypothetical protein